MAKWPVNFCAYLALPVFLGMPIFPSKISPQNPTISESNLNLFITQKHGTGSTQGMVKFVIKSLWNDYWHVFLLIQCLYSCGQLLQTAIHHAVLFASGVLVNDFRAEYNSMISHDRSSKIWVSLLRTSPWQGA